MAQQLTVVEDIAPEQFRAGGSVSPLWAVEAGLALSTQVSICKLLLVPLFRKVMGETFSFLYSQMFKKEHIRYISR